MKRVIFVILILALLSWLFFFRTSKERRLTKLGEEIVMKIEKYNSINHRLPKQLSEIGMHENDETDNYLNYKVVDSLYSIWIGLDSERSKYYYSDSKKWEDTYRDIK